MTVSAYSATAADNTSINGETIADSTLPSKVDDIIRELMADIAVVMPSGVTTVAAGGTGSSTASGARANLGLAIGTDVQAYNANLTTLAGITSGETGRALLADSTPADARTQLELGTAATQDVGTSANNVVQLNSSGELPALNASNLTDVPVELFAADEVGSYAFASYDGTGTSTFGQTRSGSSLIPGAAGMKYDVSSGHWERVHVGGTSTNYGPSSTLSGTWRCMGFGAISSGFSYPTLWHRIS